MSYFEGGINSRTRYGGGLSNIFSSAIRKMSPLIREAANTGKKAMKTRTAKAILAEAGKAALDASLQIADKTLSGENIVSPAKQNGKAIDEHVLDERLNETQNTNRKHNSQNPQNTNNRTRKKRKSRSKRADNDLNYSDIFSENEDDEKPPEKKQK